MSDFVIEIAGMDIDALIALWCQYIGVSTLIMGFIGFVSWCFWYLIRSFRVISTTK